MSLGGMCKPLHFNTLSHLICACQSITLHFELVLVPTSGCGVDYPHPEDPSLVRGWNYPAAVLCYPVEG